MLYFVVGLILFFNLVAIISIIFIEKKNPTSALAWIIVLNFLPLIGFILYFFLGSSQKLRLIRKIYKLDAVEKDILEEIVDKIYVFEGGNIEIKFKYQDEYESLLNYLEEEGVKEVEKMVIRNVSKTFI